MDKKNQIKLFKDIIGQSNAIFLLQSALDKKHIAPAYLFNGPEGVGRRKTALRFLEGIITGGHPVPRERQRLERLNHPDLIWVEPSYLSQGQVIPQSIACKTIVNRRVTPQIRLDQIKNGA